MSQKHPWVVYKRRPVHLWRNQSTVKVIYDQLTVTQEWCYRHAWRKLQRRVTEGQPESVLSWRRWGNTRQNMAITSAGGWHQETSNGLMMRLIGGRWLSRGKKIVSASYCRWQAEIGQTWIGTLINIIISPGEERRALQFYHVHYSLGEEKNFAVLQL